MTLAFAAAGATLWLFFDREGMTPEGPVASVLAVALLVALVYYLRKDSTP